MESSSYYRDMKTRLTTLFSVAAAALVLTSTAAHAQLSKPFLWELSKDGAKDAKTVTLFGSLHVGKADFYPVPDSVQKRFELMHWKSHRMLCSKAFRRVFCIAVVFANRRPSRTLRPTILIGMR